ncbi:MAG: Uma2 family endonuclease [Gammaproteobacteria bacterium]
MSIPNPHIRFSYEDYRSLVATSDKRYELFDGDIVMVPSPTSTHQEVSRNLAFLLFAHVRAQRLGKVFYAPLDVVFGEGVDREVAQPDLLFVRAERRAIIGRDAIEGAPDLVVEILSPGTKARDRGYKKSLYARFGVAEYWIVDPKAQAIEVHAIGTDGYEMKGRYRKGDRFSSPLLPGLTLPLDEVFEAE